MSAKKRRDVCKTCGGAVYVLAWAKRKPRACHGCTMARRAAIDAATVPGRIDYSKFPPYFTGDSIDRGVFNPETETHATPEQIKALQADAEYYSGRYGPDMCPAGLIPSARAVVRHCKKALA